VVGGGGTRTRHGDSDEREQRQAPAAAHVLLGLDLELDPVGRRRAALLAARRARRTAFFDVADDRDPRGRHARVLQRRHHARRTHGVHLARRAKQTAKLLGRRRGRRTRANANLRALALGGLTDDLDRRHTAVRDVDAVRVDQLRGRKADTQRAIRRGQRGAQRLEARLQRRRQRVDRAAVLVVRRLLLGGGRLVLLDVRLQLFALGDRGLGGPSFVGDRRLVAAYSAFHFRVRNDVDVGAETESGRHE